jgi:hypothetical protein
MSRVPRRVDDFAALDAAFTLPDHIEDVKLRELYEVLVNRMRAEAADLPMNTVQQLLIERIAYNYIVMREKERGALGGFHNTNSQKDFNTFWLSMTQEFNRMLTKAEVMSGQERKALLREVQQLILNTVNHAVTDPRMRSSLLTSMATAFDNVKI